MTQIYETLDQVMKDPDFDLIFNLDKIAEDYVLSRTDRLDLTVVENYEWRNNRYDYLVLEYNEDLSEQEIIGQINLMDLGLIKWSNK